jgi:hypothetical protein
MSEAFQWVVGVAAVISSLAVLGQAGILFALYRAIMEAQKAGKKAEAKFMPMVDRFETLIASSSKILEENRPRVADITTESLAAVKSARLHVDRIGVLIDETSARAKIRIAEIDQTVGNTVQQVEHATEAVKGAVMKPVKEVNGLVAGVKAALNTYVQGGNRNSPDHVTQDEEMFI